MRLVPDFLWGYSWKQTSAHSNRSIYLDYVQTMTSLLEWGDVPCAGLLHGFRLESTASTGKRRREADIPNPEHGCFYFIWLALDSPKPLYSTFVFHSFLNGSSSTIEIWIWLLGNSADGVRPGWCLTRSLFRPLNSVRPGLVLGIIGLISLCPCENQN